MSIKKILLPLTALLALSMVACSDSSSSSDSKISCTMTFMGSKMCAETSSDVADSVKTACVKDGFFITEATFKDGGCESGAAKTCQSTEDGISGTVYFYDESAKNKDCDALLDDDEDLDIEIDLDDLENVGNECEALNEKLVGCLEKTPDGCESEQEEYTKCITAAALDKVTK